MKRALCVLVVLCLVASLLGAVELEKPVPPDAQLGDEEEVVTDVGKMRVALWYFDQFEILWDTAKKMEATARMYEEKALELEKHAQTLRLVALGLGILAAVATTGTVVVAIRLARQP